MKKVKLASLIAGFSVASIAVTSCGGGGGSGNGISSSGFYQFSVNASPMSGIVFSVDPTSMSLPQDTWQFTATFNAEQGASATSAVISCEPISFSNNTIQAGTQVISSASLNFYKLGETVLQANPFQSLTASSVTSSIPIFLSATGTSSSIYSSTSQTLQYAPTETLSLSLVPSTVDIQFSYSLPATVSSTIYVSSTTLTSSSTIVSSSSSVTNYQSKYVVSGICADNGQGGFNTISSDTGINCSGSINYTNGIISNFAINQTSGATISTTTYFSSSSSSTSTASGASSSSVVVSSSTVINSYSISPGSSSSVTPTLYATYMYGTSSSSFMSNLVYGYIPSTTVFNNTSWLYVITSFVPQGVYVIVLPSTTSTTSSSTMYYPCSQIMCSYNNGIFSATLPTSFSTSDQFMLNALYTTVYTYNPLVNVTNHLSYVSVPYTFTATIEVGNGQQMTATYNSNIIVESP